MQKTPLSIRIIYVLTKIVYLLTAFFSLVGIFMAIVLFIGDRNILNKVDFEIKLPIKSDVEKDGKAFFFGQEMDVKFVGADGKLNLKDSPKIVTRTFAVLWFFIIPILFYLVHLFYRFIRNIRCGNIFEVINFKILRKLGFGLLGYWFFVVITTKIWKRAFTSNHTLSSLNFSFGDGGMMSILLSALFLLMISHVFLKGLELQEENKLTI